MGKENRTKGIETLSALCRSPLNCRLCDTIKGQQVFAWMTGTHWISLSSLPGKNKTKKKGKTFNPLTILTQ